MDKSSNSTRQFALVTGASAGIGYELAKQFGTNGFDLLIVSGGDRINNTAAELQGELGVHVQAVQADLAKHEGIHQLLSAIQAAGRPLDAAAINAGVGVSGRFVETDLAEELNMVALNVTGTVHLAKYIVKDMVARGSGRILFTASIAGRLSTARPKHLSVPCLKVSARN